MAKHEAFEIFLVAAPGLETALWAEARAAGFKSARYVPGGVTMKGGWADVWRANLELRGTGRILARIDSFFAERLPELEKRSRRVAWARVLRRDVPFKVEASCRQSRLYHTGAVEQRIAEAITATTGASMSEDAQVSIRARIDDNLCTLSVDTSGDLLHKRGHRQAVAKAPMRETMAALFLRQCGYSGAEPVVDPMCGSGTFVIEAAEIAAGLKPGRSRAFAFEQLATFDPVLWQAMRQAPGTPIAAPDIRFHGSDRDAGAIEMSIANAERAGVGATTVFKTATVSEVAAPPGPPGLVMVNPPYGDRIGDKHSLTPLYRALGQTLKSRFAGWRAGIVTNERWLAEATGLDFLPVGPPVAHGGLRVTLYRTAPLP